MLRRGLQMMTGFYCGAEHTFSAFAQRHATQMLIMPKLSSLPWLGHRDSRPFTVATWLFSEPRDYSLPNDSWSTEMLRLYEHYNSLCEEKTDTGEVTKGPWRRLPSYNRTLNYATGGRYLTKVLSTKARLFTRNMEEPGVTFEYVIFFNKQEKRCVCIFQSGHLLEGPPGYVHGGAIATMIDSVTGTLAGYLSGPVMTANLNINYRSPVSLGSVVLVHSALDRTEGKKTFVSCRVMSADDSKVHTEATGLFIAISLGRLFGG